MACYDTMMVEFQVLLVDHDTNSLFEIRRLLQRNSYRVTAVQEASNALSILSKDDEKFDLVMVDVNSPTAQGYKIFHVAAEMDIPVILMSDDVISPNLAKCAIENGALLFIEKPVRMDELKYLGQHLLREKARRNNEKRSGDKAAANTSKNNQTEEYLKDNSNEYTSMNGSRSMNPVARKKGIRIEDADCDSVSVSSLQSRKPKMHVSWTQELHEKFMDAVRILGDGKCFPKEILELMNVPGLTRMQVASHLQKCRSDWWPPQERQPRCTRSSRPANTAMLRAKSKKYGFSPCSVKGSLPAERKQTYGDLFPAATNSFSVESHVPSFDRGNMGKYGLYDDVNDTCDIPHIHPYGNQVAASSQVLPLAGPYFNITAEHAGCSANNLYVQELDVEHTLSGQISGGSMSAVDPGEFLPAWITSFTKNDTGDVTVQLD